MRRQTGFRAAMVVLGAGMAVSVGGFAASASAGPVDNPACHVVLPPPTDTFKSLTSERHSHWMSEISDQAGLGTLSIPGTHDTLAIHGSVIPPADQCPSYYMAQEDHGDRAATLDAQLNAGIRAIDIRVRVVGNGTSFEINHADAFQHATFDDVLTHARAFLAAHPSETVVMNLHGECDGDTTEGGTGTTVPGFCADDPANTTQADRIRIFNDYLAKYPGLFYGPTVTGTSTAAMPTLGAARGHIVLSVFSGPKGQTYPGYGLTQLTTGDSGQFEENDFRQCNLDKKWAEAQANLVKASNDQSGAMYITYTSANCEPGPQGSSPAEVAGGGPTGTGLNQRAFDFLNTDDGGNSINSIVFTDFPGHSLIDAIIAANPCDQQPH